MTNWIIVNINRVEICITTDKGNSERERERECAYRNYSIVNGGRDFVYFGVETPF